MQQDFLGYLSAKEKDCGNCNRTWIGTEKVKMISDGKIWIKFVECSKCKTILVLDTIRYEELPLA